MTSARLLIALANFIKFHVKLGLEVYYTIKHLEREEEVLYAKPVVASAASRPLLGDGVRLRIDYTGVINEDEEPPE